jgi:hypothetical protein
MGHEENDELRPLRKKGENYDDFEDEELSNELTSHLE